MKTKKGFTLAETLISLTIIGVIAAITVPALIQRTNKQEYVTALQKTYSTLSQAVNMIIAEEGSPKADDGGWADDMDHMYKLFRKHLNNVKECSSGRGCISQAGHYKNLNGTPANVGWWENSGYPKFVLADGAQFFLADINRDCKPGSWDASGDMRCARVIVDVNGVKGPNQWGRDLFYFILTEQGLRPSQCQNECTVSNAYPCACKVLREGAMNY